MSAVPGIARFEVRSQLRRVSTWVMFAFFGLIFFTVQAERGGLWGSADAGSTAIRINSPHQIAALLLVGSMLSVIVSAAFAGTAVYRDFQTGSYPLFFTTPVSPRAYLAGRYLGAVAANFVMLLGVPLGTLIATAWPGMDAGRIGPFRLMDYVLPLLVLVLPNLLFTCALLLALAALTRRMVAAYVGGLALLVFWATGQLFAQVIDRDWTAVLMDPFGMAAHKRAVRYWTVVELNNSPLPLGGEMLWNRLLWLGVGAAVLGWAMLRFRFAHAAEDGAAAPRVHSRRAQAAAAAEADAAAADAGLAAAPVVAVPAARRSFAGRVRLLQLAAETRRSLREVVANVWFPVLVGLCLLFVAVAGASVGEMYATTTYPVTYKVVDLLSGSFALFVIIIIAFYAGELVWNERERHAAGIHDALPVPTWVPMVARLLALICVVAALQVAAIACGMGIQVAHGYYRFEPWVYARSLLLHDLVGNYLPMLVLAVLLQTLTPHKHLGHLLLILAYVGQGVLYYLLHISHNLVQFGSTPDLKYSDMNGFGHPEVAWGWFAAYWAAWCAVLVVIAGVFWVRGGDTGARWRLRLARRRLTRPVLGAAAVALALVLGTGGFIFYNTNVLNRFQGKEERERETIHYERAYKRFEWVPQPRVTAVTLNVDIYPGSRNLRLRGAYRLVNRTGVPVDSVHVDYPATLHLRRLDLDRPTVRAVSDTAVGYLVLRLAQPLAPGDSAEMRFDLEHVDRGFTNDPEYGPVVDNGTFLNSGMLPHVGYNAEGEEADENTRRRYGLPERPRALSINDPRGRARNFVSRDADWVAFDVTVGTAGDQTAVAPGYLQRSWRQGGRRYFHYTMDAPILNFYAIQSGRYKVRRDAWKGVAIEIEVYHHPGHEYNVGRMTRSVKASLAYYTREFGPYQHRQVRIIEFPRYADYAQSFDNTIPYSEGLGFIADVGREDIDYPFFVTAHEVAHQWWGHQIAPADVQGAGMLTETLAEYSALMVMEHEYGEEKIGRFLRYELDSYLKGRSAERRAESPLAREEGQQYIPYYKGSLAMYALRDYLGEEQVNAVLRQFLADWRFRGPPYPTSDDLVRRLRDAAPEEFKHVVDDLFDHVTLFANRGVSATARQTRGGAHPQWEVTFTVESRKTHADGLGRETEVPVNDWMDLGIYGAGGPDPLYYERVHVTRPRQAFRVTVDALPARAAIDPLYKLIDRNLDDNEVKIAVAPSRFHTPPRRSADTARARVDTARRADTTHRAH